MWRSVNAHPPHELPSLLFAVLVILQMCPKSGKKPGIKSNVGLFLNLALVPGLIFDFYLFKSVYSLNTVGSSIFNLLNIYESAVVGYIEYHRP